MILHSLSLTTRKVEQYITRLAPNLN